MDNNLQNNQFNPEQGFVKEGNSVLDGHMDKLSKLKQQPLSSPQEQSAAAAPKAPEQINNNPEIAKSQIPELKPFTVEQTPQPQVVNQEQVTPKKNIEQPVTPVIQKAPVQESSQKEAKGNTATAQPVEEDARSKRTKDIVKFFRATNKRKNAVGGVSNAEDILNSMRETT